MFLIDFENVLPNLPSRLFLGVVPLLYTTPGLLVVQVSMPPRTRP